MQEIESLDTMPARMIHVTVNKPWREVYAFARDPENLPLWASGLASGLTREGDAWVGDGGPMGFILIRFAPDNEFGIIDHTVTMADGQPVLNPLRIIPNGDGAEVVFTLFRRPGLDEDGFEADAAQVLADLLALKVLLEKPAI